MAISIIIHINDTDPILCEVEALPDANDQMITVTGARRVDGKDLHYVSVGVTTIVFPVHRIAFIEILPRDEEDQIIGFVRE